MLRRGATRPGWARGCAACCCAMRHGAGRAARYVRGGVRASLAHSRRRSALGTARLALVPGWHRVAASRRVRLWTRSAAAALPVRAPPGRATVLPLPRPRHKPLKERAVYQALAMAAARTTFATTGVSSEAPPPPPAPIVQPVAAEVPAATALETERKRGGREMEEGRSRRERERIAEEEEEGAREAAPKVHTFVLAYTLLIALTAFGLAIAGGATNYWVSLRYSEPDGARRNYHGGFWHSCGAAGCRYIKPTVARPFQNSSQAFYFLTIIIACAGCMVLLVAVTRARKRRHSELAKAAGLVFLLAGLCGVIAMSSYVGKTNDTSLGANVVFYNWSFGIFTAAWATLLGLVVPLCYLVAA